MKKKISFILPIYNVENYIAKCLDSIFNQGVDENLYEIIAVIDGSPDRSIDIVRRYAQKHKNLVVVEKKNGGVSSARNAGIMSAIGEYIMFVDPDDSLIPNSLQNVIDIMTPSCAEVIVFRSFKEGSCHELYSWRDRINENILYTGFEVYERVGIRSAVWGIAYNRLFWQSNCLSFPLNIMNSEDAILFVQCQIKARQMMFIDIPVYRVFSRPESASHNITYNRLEHWFNALKLIQDIKLNDCKSPIEIAMMDSLNYSIISDITNNAIQLMGWEAKSFLYNNKIKEFLPISKENIQYSSLINRVMKNIINSSFSLFFFFAFMRRRK